MRLGNKTKPQLKALTASQRLLISNSGYLTHTLMNWALQSTTCWFPVKLTLLQGSQWIIIPQCFDYLNKMEKKNNLNNIHVYIHPGKNYPH